MTFTNSFVIFPTGYSSPCPLTPSFHRPASLFCTFQYLLVVLLVLSKSCSLPRPLADNLLGSGGDCSVLARCQRDLESMNNVDGVSRVQSRHASIVNHRLDHGIIYLPTRLSAFISLCSSPPPVTVWWFIFNTKVSSFTIARSAVNLQCNKFAMSSDHYRAHHISSASL